MVSSMLGAVVGGLGSSAKTVIGRTSQIAARVNLHIHPLCSGVCLLVNGQKNVSRAWGTADTARKWEGERRVRHPFAIHMNDI